MNAIFYLFQKNLTKKKLCRKSEHRNDIHIHMLHIPINVLDKLLLYKCFFHIPISFKSVFLFCFKLIFHI